MARTSSRRVARRAALPALVVCAVTLRGFFLLQAFVAPRQPATRGGEDAAVLRHFSGGDGETPRPSAEPEAQQPRRSVLLGGGAAAVAALLTLGSSSAGAKDAK